MYTFRDQRSAFTLIEIMIVIAIIGLIVGMGSLAYSNAVRQARDQQRKVNLDQIRSSLEIYRSNDANGTYPNDSTATLPYTPPPYLEPTRVQSYLQVPVDPGTKKPYFFRAYQSDGTSACVTAGTYCRDYTLATRLETAKTSSPCYWVAAGRCYLPDGVTTANCNYCIGPLGEK
ncbi:MAG: PSA repeat domain-containing protein [Candidatus Roizmanbacteria bacterium]